ncbi:DUF418 domain-containing protein [Natranaerobius trueperi]|uniref:DUF418 domain-containing protein n=1 Tax=Natranaerobius trueperi TaxID=759412 RepID=A0A226BZF4_9FIRM|nr:DUF418 domain-containing protein [Natranaerobius trueperi]OWZ84428.1 hypothetical protein CDO51_02675 [Natranaerobius trueperi]
MTKYVFPTEPKKRVEVVDIIRGFALFGVLLVNMTLFKSTLFYLEKTPGEYVGELNILFAWIIELFAEGKFYPIFSFLFGLGFYFFTTRAKKKGLNVVSLYRRRILGLFMFGIIHLVFIWSGDILHLYAIGGLTLLLFNDFKITIIKKFILGFFVLAILVQGGLFLSESLIIEDQIDAEVDPLEERKMLKIQALEVYQEGSFSEILSFRVQEELPFVLANVLISISDILFLFLLGMYAGKKEIFYNIKENIFIFKNVLKWGALVAIPGLIVYVLILQDVILLPRELKLPIQEIVFYVYSIALASVYISGIVILSQKEKFYNLLHPLSYVGKLALTNYLTQSIISVLVFYGYGLGLFGRVSLFIGVVITISIFILQIIWSKLWMTRFKFGPFEWLWRSYTYGELQSITK